MWNFTNLIDPDRGIVGEISTIPDHVGNPAIAALESLIILKKFMFSFMCIHT